METNTRIKDNASDLTDLECAVVEAQALDRYKRYVKAAKEMQKELTRIERNYETKSETEIVTHKRQEIIWALMDEEFNASCKIICKKHNLPDAAFLYGFGYSSGFYHTDENLLGRAIKDAEPMKAWIKAAAYGKMSKHQFATWEFLAAEDYEIIDIYWLMLGVPFYFTEEDQAIADQLGYFEEMPETLQALCTRNAHKAKKLPIIGSGFWTHFAGHCSYAIYPEEYQINAHAAKEAIEAYFDDIAADDDAKEAREKIKKIKKDLRATAAKNSKAKAYFQSHGLI